MDRSQKPFDNDIVVEDGEDYFGKSDTIGLREIVYEQYRRCCVEGSKEMVRGGTSTKVFKDKVIQVEIPNQREIFINSVKMFESVMTPEFQVEKHSKYIEEINKLKEKETDLSQEYKDEVNTFLKKYKVKGWAYSNIQDINDKYEKILVQLYMERFIIVAKIFKTLNYFDEAGAYG